MNANTLEKLKQQLLEQADSVASEIRDHTDQSNFANSDVEKAIVNSDDNLLRKVELALKRMEEGTYGTCLSCGNKIAVERLKAKPAVSLCTQCQEDKERGDA